MKIYGLIGFPILHSQSPAVFDARFKALKLTEHQYNLYPLKEIDDLPSLIHGIPNLAGLNVTIPYKKSVIPFLDKLTPEASSCGAVNTIQINRQGGNIQLIGHNTDVEGFSMALKDFFPLDQSVNALVLGNGGSSAAVQASLKNHGISYHVVARRPGKDELDWSELSARTVIEHKLIIHCTPLGMFPAVEAFPALPYESITKDHILMDLVYNPAETRFLKLGKERGARTSNGLKMLNAQAEAAWAFWNK